MFPRLTKKVKVSDPEMWYGKSEVDVSLFVTPPYAGRVYVKILVSSIDDFAVSHTTYDCNVKYTDCIKGIYDHMKEWMYDRMPEEVSVEWLYEHGYLNDC